MKKVYILENFAHQGTRYVRGEMIEMELNLAKRFEKEGLVKDAMVALGLVAPKVDLAKYVAKTEHMKALDEIKKLEAKIAQLEKQLTSKEEVKPVAKANNKKSK